MASGKLRHAREAGEVVTGGIVVVMLGVYARAEDTVAVVVPFGELS